MTSEAIAIKAVDQIIRMGLPPDVLLHATTLCNNLRLSATAEELAFEVARANGIVVGLLFGKVISQHQHDQLQGLFRVRAQITQAQYSALAEQRPAVTSSNELERFIQDMLADTIRDLARQDSPEFRGKFFGECRGLLKTLRLGNTLDEDQREQWSADIYRASIQAAEQCAANGCPVDRHALAQQRFQLEHLAERGIVPRAELPR